MLGKANKAYIKQEKLGKAIKRKRCGLYLKSYIHNLKPQIQGIELRRERLRVRRLRFDC